MAGWFIEISKSYKKRNFGKRRCEGEHAGEHSATSIEMATTQAPMWPSTTQLKIAGRLWDMQQNSNRWSDLRVPEAGQEGHFKNFAKSRMTVSGKSYAKLA
jgi:hypothetical protein